MYPKPFSQPTHPPIPQPTHQPIRLSGGYRWTYECFAASWWVLISITTNKCHYKSLSDIYLYFVRIQIPALLIDWTHHAAVLLQLLVTKKAVYNSLRSIIVIIRTCYVIAFCGYTWYTDTISVPPAGTLFAAVAWWLTMTRASIR